MARLPGNPNLRFATEFDVHERCWVSTTVVSNIRPLVKVVKSFLSRQ